MSKVVRSIGRSIGKVVSGVANAVKTVAKSKIGKAIMVAAAVYFGGAALMGAMGTTTAAGASVSGLQGAMTGISNAWGGLTAAGSSAMAGNFSQAGSQLAAGFQGQAAAGGSALAGGAAPAAATSVTPSGGAFTGATSTGLPTVAADAANVTATQGAASKGLISGAWDSLGPYGKMAAVSGATQIGGSLISGAGQQKAMEEQRAYDEQRAQRARDAYNANVGSMWWGGGASDGTYVQSPTPPRPGLVSGAMAPPAGPAAGQSYKEYMDNRLRSYNPYAPRAT